MGMSYQITQVRHETGNLIEDTWPVLYAIAAQAIAAFDADRMFSDTDPFYGPDYFVRELDRDFIATGKIFKLKA